ncbi:MAG: hypothetical protein KAQ75_08185 [Bacteroidales bacterium]|nr:hypothetical protein [Bacteroidales bacterium]
MTMFKSYIDKSSSAMQEATAWNNGLTKEIKEETILIENMKIVSLGLLNEYRLKPEGKFKRIAGALLMKHDININFNLEEDYLAKLKITDSRDGKVYKIVKIGEQWWMAENLAYKTESGCWDYNDQSNVTKYGYSYDFETAKKVCPSGWHLPIKDEFETLLDNYGGSKDKEAKYRALIPSGNSGFSASFGGMHYSDGSCHKVGEEGFFWSSSTLGQNANLLNFISDKKESSMGGGSRSLGVSVRCVQDN